MAIANYSDLKTSIANWIARSDLTSVIPDFITLAENRIYRKLRIRAMETALSDTISSGVISIPSDYVELKHAYVDGSSAQWLQRKDAEWIHQNYPTRSADGEPKYIASDVSSFIFGPYPDSTYTIKGTYYARLTALSDSNTTNWFTSNAQDLLLWGALTEAADYMDDPRLEKWNARFERILDDVQKEDDRQALSGSILTVSMG